MKNRKFTLRSRPQGLVRPENFNFVEENVPPLAAGEVLVRNEVVSLDPTHRIWMSDMPQYMPPIQLGEVIRSLGVGRVEQSNSPEFKPGDRVAGLLGWQDYSVHTSGLQLLPAGIDLPSTAFLSVLGIAGLTAYFGLLEVTSPKAGETLVVSGAAGAVGSLVGQIGLIKGLRVVGIAGGRDKCQHLTRDLGFHGAIDYRSEDVGEALGKLCPKGVDVYFDNVGGPVSEAVWSKMNLFGRVSVCGMISTYNEAEPQPGPASFPLILMKRLTVRGFIYFDFADKHPAAVRELYAWVKEGRLKYAEDIVTGLENAPTALNKLFNGTNTGKLMVKV
jgi:NADPH-dependent curcumin reductase CurA